MTRQDKRRFIRELTRSVTKTALQAVPNMPEAWDGHELRRYLADKFAEQTTMTAGPRLAQYRNEVLVRNL